MDHKVILATFVAIFLMELGDKTQIATFLMAGKHSAPWSVFAGSASALIVAALIASLCGHLLHKYVDLSWVNRITGIFFIGIGVFIFVSTFITPEAGK